MTMNTKTRKLIKKSLEVNTSAINHLAKSFKKFTFHVQLIKKVKTCAVLSFLYFKTLTS